MSTSSTARQERVGLDSILHVENKLYCAANFCVDIGRVGCS